MPLIEIDEQLLLAVLRKVESRGAIETAHRLKQRIDAVFVYVRSIDIKVDNPAFLYWSGANAGARSRKFPAIVSVGGIHKLMPDSDQAGASPITKIGCPNSGTHLSEAEDG